MDPVEKFAAAARAFAAWLMHGTDTEAPAARACLTHLLDLYRAGLALPPGWSDELENAEHDVEVDRVDQEQWTKAFAASARVPVDMYSETFDPTIVPDEEPVIGSVSDDLADIYRDVVTGLRAFDQGHRAEALWQWSFDLQSHWGAHATGAIRALHWWLSSNAPAHLAADEGAA